LIDRPLDRAGEKEDCADDGKEERMLILVPEETITDKKCDKNHIDREKEGGDTGKESEREAKACYELKTFSKICHEFCWQRQRFHLFPREIRFHCCAIKNFPSMVSHHESNEDPDEGHPCFIKQRTGREEGFKHIRGDEVTKNEVTTG
jgi:hypothetical protein